MTRHLMEHFRTPPDSRQFGYNRPAADDSRFSLAEQPKVEGWLPFPERVQPLTDYRHEQW